MGRSIAERVRQLQSLLPAALYQYKASKGIGIAIDADDPQRGFDVTLIRDRRLFTEADKAIGAYLYANLDETLVADQFGKTKNLTR